MFDCSPEEYLAIEGVDAGYHRLSDLPPFTCFRSSEHRSLKWVVNAVQDIHGRILVTCLSDRTRDFYSNPGITVWVD